MQHPGIAVLDFGSQYTQTIARRLRQLRTFSEIFEPDVSPNELTEAKGIVLSGGPASVYQAGAPKCQDEIFGLGKPVLGICYGFQYMAHRFGGNVERREKGEYGRAALAVSESASLFTGMSPTQEVWMSHGDTVTKLPPGYRALASTADCEYAGAWNPAQRVVGVQFHPEVDHTKNGLGMLQNFLEMCGPLGYEWSMQNHITASIEQIRRTAGDRNVCHLTSGGGDSTVAAIQVQRALRRGQATFVYMDPGIMRKGETEYVRKVVKDVGLELTVLDTSEHLEKQLAGVIDPEEKRDIIGTHFVREAKDYMRNRGEGDAWILGQGTIYPDHIESQGTKYSAKIKMHHNRVKEVREMIKRGRVVEPNLYLFKDELRELARELAAQFPEHQSLETVFAKRHPFPGPGLAIRTLCSDGHAEDLNSVSRRANEIAGQYDLKAAVLPVRSVGVQGDERSFAHPAVLWGDTDWETLDKTATDLTNSLRGQVNRAVYAWEPRRVDGVSLHEGYVTRARLDRLREADAVVMDALEQSGWMSKIGQCPTISIPVGLNGSGADTIVIRPVTTKDYMTASFSRLPHDVVDNIATDVTRLGFSGLLYDVTHKPPGTIEWE